MQNNYHEILSQGQIINNIINPQIEHADVYSFDDLLISCGHEAMTNGIRSTAIPGTIQDWISGKICEALPHRLVQRLLAYLIENRDATEVLEYRESKGGDVPELTLLFHRTAKSKARKQKEGREHTNITGSINGYSNDLDPITGSVTENNLFRSGTVELEDDGLKFFSAEMIVSRNSTNQTVPTADKSHLKRKLPAGLGDLNNKIEETDDTTFVTVKGKARDIKLPLYGQSSPKISEPSRKDTKPTAPLKRDRKSSNNQDSSNSDSSDGLSDGCESDGAESRNPRYKNDNMITKKSLKARKYHKPAVLQQRVECHLCKKIFPRNSPLFVHQRAHHAEYWAAKPKIGKGQKRGGWLDKDQMVCNICEDYKTNDNQKMDDHYETEHPDYWQIKLQHNPGFKSSVTRMKLNSMQDEIVQDEGSGLFTCTICSKQFKVRSQIVLHVERVHRKIKGDHVCEVCGFEVSTAVNLRKHMFTHTKNYPFNCVDCKKGFATKHTYVEVHLKKHHPDEYNLERLRKKIKLK